MLLNIANAQNNCGGQNLSPCICASSFNNYIKCDRVPMEEVRQVFARINLPVIDQLDLILSATEDTIPDDILSDQQVDSISLLCHSPQNILKVDRDAFRSSRSFAKGVSIGDCDLSQLNFNFIEGFNRLASLGFDSTPNLQPTLASTLPDLPALIYFTVSKCPDFGREGGQFPTLSLGLNSLYVYNNNWDDDQMGRVLDWALQSSANSLQSLYLAWNRLKQFPSQVASFPRVNYLWLHDNSEAMIIPSGSYNSPLFYMDLSRSNITEVQEKAFQGI